MSIGTWFLKFRAKFVISSHCVEVSKYGEFSGPYFFVFGLNTKIYFVNLRIQSEYRKIKTRKNSVVRHFSSSFTVMTGTCLVLGTELMAKNRPEKSTVCKYETQILLRRKGIITGKDIMQLEIVWLNMYW